MTNGRDGGEKRHGEPVPRQSTSVISVSSNEIIARGPARSASKTATSEGLPTDRLLERLQPIEDTIQGRGNQLQQVGDIFDLSRAQIGAALGMSRQSAWERFS
jgi:hypothetical protein